MRGGKPARKKKILAVCGAALAVGLSLLSIRNAFVSAVALEQQARCGAAEHQHSTACYEGDRLVCGCKEHTHNRNCYLVLLKDNDINSLLSYVGSDKSHNLETLIYQTVGTALYYQEDLEAVTTGTGPYLSGTALPSAETAMTQSASSSQDMDISTLNETISEKAIEPNLVLNEDLYNASAVSIVPGDTAAVLGSTAGGVSTLAVGDTAQTGNNNANFYVYLDGQWKCIGTLAFEVSESGNWWKQYTPRVGTADVVSLINTSLGTGFTRSDFDLRYSTSESFASSSEATINKSPEWQLWSSAW